jgi:hypothetical protein
VSGAFRLPSYVEWPTADEEPSDLDDFKIFHGRTQESTRKPTCTVTA